MKKSSKIIWGVALILVGVLIALNQLEILKINLFFEGWWTLFIIVPCVIGLCRKENFAGNLIGIAIGVALLLMQQNVIDFELIWKLWLPILLVCIGVGFIFSNKGKPDYSDEIATLCKEVDSDETLKDKKINGFAAFSGSKYKADGENFVGGDLTAVFGGLNYDFRNSVFTGKTVLNVSAIFGGIDLFLPENVIVKIKSTSIFGGVEDKRKSAQSTAEDAPVVYVNALAMFGGVDIK